jgi:hypothetical protein
MARNPDTGQNYGGFWEMAASAADECSLISVLIGNAFDVVTLGAMSSNVLGFRKISRGHLRPRRRYHFMNQMPPSRESHVSVGRAWRHTMLQRRRRAGLRRVERVSDYNLVGTADAADSFDDDGVSSPHEASFQMQDQIVLPPLRH